MRMVPWPRVSVPDTFHAYAHENNVWVAIQLFLFVAACSHVCGTFATTSLCAALPETHERVTDTLGSLLAYQQLACKRLLRKLLGAHRPWAQRRASLALRRKEVSFDPKQPILAGYHLATARDDRFWRVCSVRDFQAGLGGDDAGTQSRRRALPFAF